MWTATFQGSISVLFACGVTLILFALAQTDKYERIRWGLGFICVVCVWIMTFSASMVVATGE